MANRLLETIQIINGIPQNLAYHQARMDRSKKAIFENSKFENLADALKMASKYAFDEYRCRVLYTSHIEEIQFIPYQRKKINSLKIIEANIDYTFKWENREGLNNLYAQRGTAQDILIVKDGFITDSLYANIILKNKEGLFTPDTPLLAGTMRQKLLDIGAISAKKIRLKDLEAYSHFCLINTFWQYDESNLIPIKNIVF